MSDPPDLPPDAARPSPSGSPRLRLRAPRWPRFRVLHLARQRLRRADLWTAGAALGASAAAGALCAGFAVPPGWRIAAVALGPLAAIAWRIGARPRQLDREEQIQRLIDANRYEAAGDLLLAHQQHERALALYLHSGTWNKASVCYVALGQPAHAAELYARSDRHAEAAHYFQRAEEWSRAAECLLQIGNRRDAAELYERAGNFEAAAELLLELGDWDSSARLFERARLPGRAAAALTRAGNDPVRRQQAAALFEQAGELQEAARCYSSLGEWEHAAELFDCINQPSLAAQAFERAGDHRHAAERYAQTGWLREARANYEKAGDLAGAAQMALRLGQDYEAGRIFYQLGAYDHALEALQRVASDTPYWRDATLLMARIFSERNLLDRATGKLESLRAVPPRSPLDHPAVALLADVRERSGDLLGALQLLEILADHDPDDPELQRRLQLLQDRAWGGSNRTRGGGDQEQRYELIEEIGRGGMGVVYLAHDRELERAVALKFPPRELAEDANCLQAFRREARAAAAMNHPNIVHVYDVTVVAGQPCIVMEHVQGQTLRKMLRDHARFRGRALPGRRVAEIARDVCRALAYAHAQQVIHRDVKPSNVMVSDRGLAKLMDFGVSKVMVPGGERDARAQGTPQYMAPEHLVGGDVDGRADLYSLGIAVFEACTGQRPFDGPDVAQQQLNRELPDPCGIEPELAPTLAHIIQKACAKNPNQRFQSAREMADALTGFLTSLV